MPDYSKMSDKELLDLVGGSASKDYSAMSDEQLLSLAGEGDISSEGFTTGDKIKGSAALVGAGALGYGTYKGVQRYREPYKLKGALQKELLSIGDSAGDIDVNSIPKLLRAQKSDILSQAKVQSLRLGEQLKAVDNVALPKTANDLANHIVANSPEFNKNLSKGYSTGIESISQAADEAGFKFTTKNFDEDVIGKALEQAQRQNVPPEALKRLEKARETLQSQSKVTDAFGKPFGSSLNIKDANASISKLTEAAPYSPESAILRKTWSEFLEANAPESVKPMIQKLNANFKPAVQLRTLVAKFSDPKTGTLDTKRFSRYISDYAKGARSGDVEDAMKLLMQGNDVVPAMAGVDQRFDALKKVAEQRSSLASEASKLKIATAQAEQTLSGKIKSAEILLSKIGRTNQRISNRNLVGKAVKYVLGPTLRGGLRALGPLGMVGQAGQLAEDPGEALRNMMFTSREKEEEQYKKWLQQLDIKVGEGKMTREEADFQRFRAQGGI